MEDLKNIKPISRDYPVSVVNWAVHAENLSLKNGKEYFSGKAMTSGFNNVKMGLQIAPFQRY